MMLPADLEVTAAAFFIVFARVGAVLMLLPVFGDDAIPGRIRLLIARTLAMPGTGPCQPDVAGGIGDRPTDETDRAAGDAAALPRLVHQVERDGGDQHARTDRHHRRDQPLRQSREPGDQRTQHQRRSADQTPEAGSEHPAHARIRSSPARSRPSPATSAAIRSYNCAMPS